jgi:hypothetical protein
MDGAARDKTVVKQGSATVAAVCTTTYYVQWRHKLRMMYRQWLRLPASLLGV